MIAFTWIKRKPTKPGRYLSIDTDCSSNPFLSSIEIVDGELYVTAGWSHGKLKHLKGYLWSSIPIEGPK